jgi:hypothetical protein
VEDIAPHVVMLVSKRRANACSVKDRLARVWLTNGPTLGELALAKFFLPWRRLASIVLDPGREDKLVWRWTEDGCYSSKSAYNAFFAGAVTTLIVDEIWYSRTLYNCKFFVWQILKNRCWTADRLQCRGLPLLCKLRQ